MVIGILCRSVARLLVGLEAQRTSMSESDGPSLAVRGSPFPHGVQASRRHYAPRGLRWSRMVKATATLGRRDANS